MIIIKEYVVIGNFLIEYFKHHHFAKRKTILLPIDDIVKFNTVVTSIVKKDNMYTTFTGYQSVQKFKEEFGFFGISISNDNTNIIITHKLDITILNRYFRIGIYKSLVKTFEDSYKIIYK